MWFEVLRTEFVELSDTRVGPEGQQLELELASGMLPDHRTTTNR